MTHTEIQSAKLSVTVTVLQSDLQCCDTAYMLRCYSDMTSTTLKKHSQKRRTMLLHNHYTVKKRTVLTAELADALALCAAPLACAAASLPAWLAVAAALSAFTLALSAAASAC
jgi:hypothetical protein